MAGKNGGARKGAGRKPGVPNIATREFKEWMKMVLERPVYIHGLVARLDSGDLDSRLELYFHQMVHGKPKDTIAVEASTNLAELLGMALSLKPEELGK